MLCTEI